MGFSFKSSQPDIEKYRKTFSSDKCNIKYYPDLEYLDIYDDIRKASKKKSKSLEEITTPYYSIGYFLDNKLVRIDNVGTGIPKETYIIWESESIKEVHEFFLGWYSGKRISNKTQASSSWFYSYQNGLLKKILWIMYEDRKYFDHGEMKVTFDYEYDNKGPLFIRKTVMGTGKLWKEPQVDIIYDREKEKFLKTCTITKSSLIGTEGKESDGIINFKLQDNQKTCGCRTCGKLLSYIATISLLDKRFNLDNIQIQRVPVLYCFDCLESQSYNISGLKILVQNETAFTEKRYRFKKETDEEILQDSFLKLGGQPFWIQQDEHPNCQTCEKTMKFIIEINTDESLTNGIDTLAFGDSGKLYAFACCDNIVIIPQWY